MLDDPLVALFAQVQAEQEIREEAENQEAARLNALIGDSGGPPLAEPFGIGAPWLQYAEEAELADLAQLHTRIERKKLLLSEAIAKRSKIMNRCIRRMRRASGKD